MNDDQLIWISSGRPSSPHERHRGVDEVTRYEKENEEFSMCILES